MQTEHPKHDHPSQLLTLKARAREHPDYCFHQPHGQSPQKRTLRHKTVLEIKKNTKLPILVGFGIDNSNQVKEINKFADGCVIGSAIINLIEESNKEKYSIERILSKIKLFLSGIKKGN